MTIRHRTSGLTAVPITIVLLATTLTGLALEMTPAAAKPGPAKVGGRAVGTYESEGGAKHATATLTAKITYDKSGRPTMTWRLKAAQHLAISRWEIVRKGNPSSVRFYSNQEGRGTLRGSISTYTKSLYKHFSQLANKPHKFILQVYAGPDDGYGTVTLKGKVLKGKAPNVPPKKVKTKRPRWTASDRFHSVRVKLSPVGKRRLDRTVAVMTDKETEWVEGNSLICWMAGGGLGGVIAATGRLRGEVQDWIGPRLRSFPAVQKQTGYTACELLTNATLAYLASVHDVRVNRSTARAKSSCRVVPVPVYLGEDGRVHLSELEYLPPRRLDYPTCRLKKQNRRLIIKASTPGDQQSLREVGPKLRMTVGDRRSPKTKPKVKIAAKQYGQIS